MQLLLSDAGSDVLVVGDRRELGEALQRFAPEVIVADYHLDDGDTGIDALHWALAGVDAPPCIIVSADDGHSVREQARAAGFRTLSKPVNPGRLIALIRALATASGMENAARAGK
jgi:DNA-binding response OmpR family regulator